MKGAHEESEKREEKIKLDNKNALFARAANLVIFKAQALPLIANIQEKISNVNVPLTENALQETDSIITKLESCERKITEWKREGFNTAPLEKLQDKSIPEILEIFGRYEENILRLQTVKIRIKMIEGSDPEYVKDPDAHARITAVKQALIAIDNTEAVESGLRAIETELEKFRKSRKQKEELATLLITLTRAQDIVANEKNPEIQKLFSAGEYEGVIRLHEKQQYIADLVADQVNNIRERVRQLYAEAEKIGTVPDSLKINIQTQDIATLEQTIKDLDSFIANAKPELTLSRDHTQRSAEKLPDKNKSEDFEYSRKILRDIYHQYGDSIIEDPRQFLALFKDLSKGQFIRELNLIKLSFSENIPSELYKKKDQVPFQILGPQLVTRLHETLGMEKELAEWVVESWALTLGIL